MINARLQKLHEYMSAQGIDVYFLSSNDNHLSEYVADYFKVIAYYSSFTGSVSSMLIDKENAYIFVDGRYHLQADKQCIPNGINVVKLGLENQLDPIAFIEKNYSNCLIGLDGKRNSVSFVKKLLEKGINVRSIDLYSESWQPEADFPFSMVREIANNYSGLSRKRKLEMLRYYLKDKIQIVNNLDAIAYILNLRGDDIPYTPVFLSYLVIAPEKAYLFADYKRFSSEVIKHLNQDGIEIKPYDDYYLYLKFLNKQKIVYDENKTNYETYRIISKNNILFSSRSLIDKMKAIKNPIEQNNIRMAHIYDGIAVLRFLMWLDKADKSNISEYDAARKIDEFRKNYRAEDLSFSSIVACNQNAAIIHYSPSKDDSSMLSDEGILLFDTGGQYPEGTTDITRTISLGKTSEEIKKYFTIVLKAMFNLSELKFLQGLSGNQLDVIVRKELWQYGIDYRHGTGHGVGYNLSVHEGPPNIRYNKLDSGDESAIIKPGMVFSDESGVYFEGLFGIRCENLLLCQKDVKNTYGNFLKFETLTLVPFDLKLIDKNYLDERTIRALNNYHQRVYDTLLPYINEEEAEFLERLTRKI